MATNAPLSAESYQTIEGSPSAQDQYPQSPPGPEDTQYPAPQKKSRKFWSSKRTDPINESSNNVCAPSHHDQNEISTVPRSPEMQAGPGCPGNTQANARMGQDHGKSFESSRERGFGTTTTAESYGSMKAYKVYKRRFVGLFILALLNGITAANAVLFTTITDQSSKFFSISITRVNWLSNIFAVMYLILGFLVPSLVQACAIQGICVMAAIAMTLGAWLRYAASCVPDIQSGDYIMPPYLLLFVGSMLIGVAQPMLQIIGPSYSELFFTPRYRLATTMFIAISNPLGQAITDLVVPKLVPDTPNHREIRLLLLIVAIVTMIFSLTVLFIRSQPPTPPSMTCELPRLSSGDAWRVLFGRSQKIITDNEEEKSEGALSRRATVTVVRRNSALQFELDRPDTFNSDSDDQHSVSHESLGKLSKKSRVDIALLTILFSVVLGAFTAYTTLISQIYIPYGFNSTQAGLFVASLIFPGVIAATILLPIMGRFCPKLCVQVVKIFGPLIGLAYAGLIWIVKGRDMGGIHLTNILIGVFSFMTLPIVLELAADATYTAMRPEFSSALLYTSANGSGDGPTPHDMSRSLIFQGGAVLLAALSIIGLQGRQRRPDLKTRRRSRRPSA
ncbi:major facilitator superfamily domain-containing protein [Melampsora americana]|nr:major facilitator superfamily domain-containing protein [Melampsora americana]